jgi:DNA mismatch endonuclease (patch repair protein)
MQANRRVDTAPELGLRSNLHARGLRFRKDYRLVIDGLSVRPDIVFTRAKVAVFVDGCFWHRCPLHAQAPKANGEWWREKLDRTVARDRRNDNALIAAGWTVIRVWEHESFADAAQRIDCVVRQHGSVKLA